MKELVNKIYEKKSQYDILETQYKDICDQMESLDKDIKELSSKLLDEVKNTEEFKKHNYFISDVIERMKNYYEIHHSNKNKGKRLTIKKS